MLVGQKKLYLWTGSEFHLQPFPPSCLLTHHIQVLLYVGTDAEKKKKKGKENAPRDRDCPSSSSAFCTTRLCTHIRNKNMSLEKRLNKKNCSSDGRKGERHIDREMEFSSFLFPVNRGRVILSNSIPLPWVDTITAWYRNNAAGEGPACFRCETISNNFSRGRWTRKTEATSRKQFNSLPGD